MTLHQCPLCPSLLLNQQELERHRLLYHPDHQEKLVLDAIKTMKAQVLDILQRYPETRPRAKRAYKMLYLRWSMRYGGDFVYNENNKKVQMRNLDGIGMERWLKMPDEQSIGRIARFVKKDHPELLQGMNPLKQIRAAINERTSERFYAGASG